MPFIFYTSIERGGDEFDLCVAYEATQGCPARLYGDFPHPSEPPSVEILSITAGSSGEYFATSDEEGAQILVECEQRAQSDLEDKAAEAAEWRAQCHRDDKLMGDV